MSLVYDAPDGLFSLLVRRSSSLLVPFAARSLSCGTDFGSWRKICSDCNCCPHSRTVRHELTSLVDVRSARRWLTTTVAVEQHRAVGDMHRLTPGIKAGTGG